MQSRASPFSTPSLTGSIHKDHEFVIKNVEIPDQGVPVSEDGTVDIPSSSDESGIASEKKNDDTTSWLITDAVFNMLPLLIWGIEEPNEADIKKMEAFSKQLTIYCDKNGISMLDYLFDELGLVLTGIPLIMSIKNRVKAKKESKIIKLEKGTEEFEHQKELDQQKENDKIIVN